MSDKALDTTHNPGFEGGRHGKHIRHTSHDTLPHHQHDHGHIQGSQVPSGEVEDEVVLEGE